MAPHAAGSFEISEWTEDRGLDEDGDVFVRTRVRKVFSGDLTGTSTADLVMAYLGGEPTAYLGFERFTARLAGRDGTFVLTHVAGTGLDGGQGRWDVLPGSGTGGLAGLTGSATVVRHDDGSHSFTLDHTLPGESS